MESKPTKAFVHRVVASLKTIKRKDVSLDMLSKKIGIYPDVLGRNLQYFEPMILMDPSINCRALLPQFENYLKEPISEKKAKAPALRIAKAELASYSSIADFVYKKMTSVGGLVDTAAELSDHDLEILRRLVTRKSRNARRSKKEKRIDKAIKGFRHLGWEPFFNPFRGSRLEERG